jgi:hypothetical protein
VRCCLHERAGLVVAENGAPGGDGHAQGSREAGAASALAEVAFDPTAQILVGDSVWESSLGSHCRASKESVVAVMILDAVACDKAILVDKIVFHEDVISRFEANCFEF